MSTKQRNNKGNYVRNAVKGCHIAYFDADWLIDYDVFDPEEMGIQPGQDIPDISIDPEQNMLSVINASQTTRCYYISMNNRAQNANNKFLEMGTTRDEYGRVSKCITFVLVVEAGYIMDVCYVETIQNAQLDLYSHTSDFMEHPEPEAFDNMCVYPFPLGGNKECLCTQGHNGHFTHFAPGTYHAVDFRCPVGTPVLAIGDGEVVDVVHHNKAGGIHAKNLFVWNSVMIKLDDGYFVEYVHIKPDSVIIKKGDRVKVGQIICESGDIGFCPEPHLHVQMHRSCDEKAPTIKFAFKDQQGVPYFPVAGKQYSLLGVK